MTRTHDSLKNASINGQIPEKKALEIGLSSDDLLKRSVVLLTDLEKHVGMFLGGKISTLVGDITNVRAKDSVYFFDREPDGQ